MGMAERDRDRLKGVQPDLQGGSTQDEKGQETREDPPTPYVGLPWLAQIVKNPPAIRETPVQSPGWEAPLEKGNGNPLQYSWVSFLAQMVKKKKKKKNPNAMRKPWV